MKTNPISIGIDPDDVVRTLRQQAIGLLDRVEGEMLLDFSAVRRIDPSVARTMEELADVAETKAVKVVLRAVNIDVYKALKLLGLAQRFSFVD